MRWTRAVEQDERRWRGRRSRVVLTPRRWRQEGGSICQRRWQTSPVTEESAKETVKTIARGMPGASGVTVVTLLVCSHFLRTQGCGRIERPAFPAPSDSGRRAVRWSTRAFLVAGARSCVLRHSGMVR